MQRLEVSGAVRPIYGSLGVKRLTTVYFVNQPLHVSGIFAAHHQEVYCIYTAFGMFCAS